MKYRAFSLLTVVVIISLAGCSSGYRAIYDIGLIDTERPADAENTYGPQVVKVIGEVGQEISHFEDNLLAIGWRPTPDEFDFELTNKTAEPIEIIWDDGAYVDENGERHRIVNSKVIHEDREKHQKPTVVAGGSKVVESIRSADNIYYEQGINSRFRETPFFPMSASTQEELDQQTAPLLKKTVKLALPFRVSGEQHVYVFVFELKNIQVKKAKVDEGQKRKSKWVDEDVHVPDQYR